MDFVVFYKSYHLGWPGWRTAVANHTQRGTKPTPLHGAEECTGALKEIGGTAQFT